jgi:tetratricopeptide (TPR) repeat protein
MKCWCRTTSASAHAGDLDRKLGSPDLVERGKLYLKKARFDLAITDFGEAIRLAPLTRTRVAGTETRTGDPLMEEAYLNRGTAYQQTGNRDAAIADFRKVLTFAPSHAEAIRRLKELGVAP